MSLTNIFIISNHSLACSIVLFAWAKNWEGNTIYSITFNVLSLFQAANQYSLLNTVQYLLQTVLIPFYAKLSDIWGRTEVFALSLFFYIISGVVYACAQRFSDFAVSIFDPLLRVN